MEELARWEWLILEVGFLAFLVYQLVSIRRSIARDKAEAARKMETGK